MALVIKPLTVIGATIRLAEDPFTASLTLFVVALVHRVVCPCVDSALSVILISEERSAIEATIGKSQLSIAMFKAIDEAPTVLVSCRVNQGALTLHLPVEPIS